MIAGVFMGNVTMKKVYYTLFFVLLSVYGLSYLLPAKDTQFHYSDAELRATALGRNMNSIPSEYSELLKLVDSEENRLSKAKIELGRELYFEKMLSGDKQVSCNTCHMLSKEPQDKERYLKALLTTPHAPKSDCRICHEKDESGTDRQAFALNSSDKPHPYLLNTLSTLNAALAKYQTWDAGIESIEDQVGHSLIDSFEMNISVQKLEKRLRADKNYALKFELAFKDDNETVSLSNVEKALGAYLRTLVTRSAYDEFLDGNDSAMSSKAKKGMANFINFGCKGCHTGITVGGQTIQKFPVRDYNSIIDITNSFNEVSRGREVGTLGLNIAMRHNFPFKNEGGFMGMNEEQLFRVPILRNVTKTSPYFHNGEIQNIREAVFIMAKHQLGMNLSNEQIDEIVEFLKALEGDIVEYEIPKEVRQ